MASDYLASKDPGVDLKNVELRVMENSRPPSRKESGELKETMKKILGPNPTKVAFWLIGCGTNKELNAPYGRRFIKDILETALENGSFLVCQGTDKFLTAMRSQCEDPKILSAKKKLKVYVNKNPTTDCAGKSGNEESSCSESTESEERKDINTFKPEVAFGDVFEGVRDFEHFVILFEGLKEDIKFFEKYIPTTEATLINIKDLEKDNNKETGNEKGTTGATTKPNQRKQSESIAASKSGFKVTSAKKEQEKSQEIAQEIQQNLGLKEMYTSETFSISNFLFEAFQQRTDTSMLQQRTDTSMLQQRTDTSKPTEKETLLRIYLNCIDDEKKKDYPDGENVVFAAVTLYRQKFWTELCRNKKNGEQKNFVKEYINGDLIIKHLKNASWCKEICASEKVSWCKRLCCSDKVSCCKRQSDSTQVSNALDMSMVKAEIRRRIEDIIGQSPLPKKVNHPVRVYPEPQKQEPKYAEVLFIDAVLENKLEASILYWSLVEHPVTAALIAYGLFKALRKKDKRLELKENMNTYSKLAMEAVNNSYVKNSSDTFKMLMTPVEEWGNMSCVQIALTTKNREFLSEQPLLDLQEQLWIGQPLEAEDQQTDEEKLNSILKIFSSPRSVYVYSLIFYIVFLVMYGLLLLFFLQKENFHVLEFIIPAWVLTLALHMIDKTFPFSKHVIDAFYSIDVCAILFYCLALCLRIGAFFDPSNQDVMDVARLFFSLDYFAFTLRLLHFCMGSESYGPIVAMIFKMCKTLFKFLAIIGIFLLGSVVATESVMYPEAPLKFTELYFIFRKPYWSMFGEFFLSEIESRGDYCTNDPLLYNNHTEIRCSTEVGRYYGPILMAMFVLVSNILIFSLLVAKFNSDIMQIEEKSQEIANHLRFKLTMEYYRMIFLQPPLLFVCIVCGVFRYYKEMKTENNEKREYLIKFEKDVVSYIKQRIDDGTFFRRLNDYKKVVKKTSLKQFQSSLSEINKLTKMQKKAEEDLKIQKNDLETIKKSIEELSKKTNNANGSNERGASNGREKPMSDEPRLAPPRRTTQVNLDASHIQKSLKKIEEVVSELWQTSPYAIKQAGQQKKIGNINLKTPRPLVLPNEDVNESLKRIQLMLDGISKKKSPLTREATKESINDEDQDVPSKTEDNAC